MNKQIKNGVIHGLAFLLTIFIAGISFATYTQVNGGEPLTANAWNNILSKIDNLENVDVWHNPVLENGRINYGGSYDTTSYFKDRDGNIHITGMVKNGTLLQCIFTLPEGYRPVASKIFPVIAYDSLGRVDVNSNGCVKVVFGNNSRVTLNGIIFETN